MNIDEFLKSIAGDAPPDNLPDTLQALWYAEKGDWDTAHRVAQDISGSARWKS